MERLKRVENTLVKSCWMVFSGKTPRDSGPHSFSNDWQMLYTTPLLISEVLDRRQSMLMAATFNKSAAGWSSASVNR